MNDVCTRVGFRIKCTDARENFDAILISLFACANASFTLIIASGFICRDTKNWKIFLWRLRDTLSLSDIRHARGSRSCTRAYHPRSFTGWISRELDRVNSSLLPIKFVYAQVNMPGERCPGVANVTIYTRLCALRTQISKRDFYCHNYAVSCCIVNSCI